MKPEWAFVLAAGYGTRLKPFSLKIPKPAWPLFDLPLASHALFALAGAGAKRVVVNLHHLPGELRAILEPAAPPGLDLHWSFEPEILGTGGALLPWAERLGEGPFWLVNGDTYRDFDLSELACFHEERNALATLSLAPLPREAQDSRRAPIEIDETGRIVRFLGATAPGTSGNGLPCDFTGVHLLEPGVLRAAEAVGAKSFCINADVHKRLVAEGKPLYGFLPGSGSFWSDLGTPERYLAAHRELLQAGKIPPRAPGRFVAADEETPEGGSIFAPSFLGAGARVERDATVGPLAVLGAGSAAQTGARVRDAVVWPSARVSSPIERAVVAPWGETLGEDGRVGVLS
jgi:mannose-1-phosphate guanylyltransferase